MTTTDSKKSLQISGAIAALSAIWHLLCIWGGPNWFAFARAPIQIIESAQQGTWLAPVGTVIVASLMMLCALFAFSASGNIRRLPLLKSALSTIALLCILRGLLVFPALFLASRIDYWQVIASSIWLFVGISFARGAITQFTQQPPTTN